MTYSLNIKYPNFYFYLSILLHMFILPIFLLLNVYGKIIFFLIFASSLYYQHWLFANKKVIEIIYENNAWYLVVGIDKVEVKLIREKSFVTSFYRSIFFKLKENKKFGVNIFNFQISKQDRSNLSLCLLYDK